MGASVEYILGLRDRLNAAPHGDRRGMVTDAARLLGLSAQTVYRRLAAYGWTSGRKHRADKGTTCVPRELARLAGGMVHTATRANGKKTLPLTTACKILEADGNGCKIIPETGEVVMPDPSTVARIAKRHGCHPEQLKRGKPAIEMQSPHPNWCWQVDASVCTVFYLPKGKVHVIDDAKIYKNKPAAMAEAANEKVIRWVVTDHYSGAFFLRYSQGAEDTAHLLDAIIETMCRRGGTENDCLYGVPHIIMADKGSSVRSGPSRSLFDALNIKLALHTVGNPRAKGQVEQAQNLVETQFEGRLRMYTVGSLADLNAQADNWRIAYNLTVEHSRHKRTRHAMWRTITEEQLRIPASAEALRDLAMSGPMPVTVPHNLVLARTLRGYGRQEYDLRNIPGILPKMTLSMRVNPFRAPCVDLTLTDADGTQRVYTVEPLQRNEAGFRVDAPVIGQEFKALKDTAIDTALKDIQKEAYGADTLQDAAAARNDKQRAYAGINPMADVEAVPLRQFIPKRGRDLTLAPTLKEAAPLGLVDAAFALRNKLAALGVEWGTAHMRRLQELYPDGKVPAGDMPELPGLLLDADAAVKRAEMKLVSGGAA